MIIIFIEDCEHFDEDIDTSVASLRKVENIFGIGGQLRR